MRLVGAQFIAPKSGVINHAPTDAPTPQARSGQARPSPYARIEYVSICDPQTLQEVQKIEGKTLIALAVWIGKTHLIDNLTVRQR